MSRARRRSTGFGEPDGVAGTGAGTRDGGQRCRCRFLSGLVNSAWLPMPCPCSQLEANLAQELEEQVNSTVKRLSELISLAPGWDRRNSEAITLRAAQTALGLIVDVLEELPQLRTPFVAPLASGGLQLEWNGPTRELVLSITPGGRVTAAVLDLRTHEQVEIPAAQRRTLHTELSIEALRELASDGIYMLREV